MTSLKHRGNLLAIACFYLIVTERLPIVDNIHSVEVIYKYNFVFSV